MNADRLEDGPAQATGPEVDPELFDDGLAEQLGPAIEPPATAVKATIEHLLASASANAAFGHPVQHEQGVLVPAAEIVSVIGFGFDAGKVPRSAADQLGNGTSGGGGGYVVTRPVAAIVLTPHQIRQEVIGDVTKIALAAVSAAGVTAGLLFRLRGSRDT
jgi:uncharacterized spore protein YtfJ